MKNKVGQSCDVNIFLVFFVFQQFEHDLSER